MQKIRLHQSSSTKLALLFSGALTIVLILLTTSIYDMMHGEQIHPVFMTVLLGITGLMCVGLFIISYYVTKRINTMVATADAVMTTRDLSQRIPIDSEWDDLSKLAATLNMMLDDIEQLVAGVRQVSDNIAHDLRTPLTRMRNHIESMRAADPGATTPQCLTQLAQECDGLMTTFNALLRIANIEAGRNQIGTSQVNLGSLLHDAIDLYEPLAREKLLQLTYTIEDVMVMGDKDMLFQAITNLLDNAIKYTPAGGAVQACAAPEGKGAILVISDTGCGIADADKANVFKRFYRVDSSRSKPGAGLGLSLVAAVIALHQGSIKLDDHFPSGLMVTVKI